MTAYQRGGNENLADQARNFREAGRYDDAIDIYKTICHLYPDNELYMAECGYCYLEQGTNLDTAQSWLIKAIQAGHDDEHKAYAYSLLAQVAQKRGDLEGIQVTMTRALQLDPTETSYREAFGDMLLEAGAPVEANKHYLKAYGEYYASGFLSLNLQHEGTAAADFNVALRLDHKSNLIAKTGQSVDETTLLRSIYTNAMSKGLVNLAEGCASVLATFVSNEAPSEPRGALEITLK